MDKKIVPIEQDDFHGTDLGDPARTVKLYINRKQMIRESNQRLALVGIPGSVLIGLVSLVAIYLVIGLKLYVYIEAQFAAVASLCFVASTAFSFWILSGRSKVTEKPTIEISTGGIRFNYGPPLGDFKLIPWKYISDAKTYRFLGTNWIGICVDSKHLASRTNNVFTLCMLAVSVPFAVFGIPFLSFPGHLFSVDADSIVALIKERRILALESRSNTASIENRIELNGEDDTSPSS